MNEENESKDETTFPTADVVPRQSKSARLSKLWWLTGACVLLAIGLTWASSKSPGTEVDIRFDQGHGLQVGDAVRYRGIDVGKVIDISLDDDLSEIVAKAMIDADASLIAREGSRFWIVRPQIDVSGVSGLDTAVGAKYIRVIPGMVGDGGDLGSKRRIDFKGLSNQPADDQGTGGIEFVLRGGDRHGIHPGAPITWRGIEVGRILSASLSPDATEVDIRGRIDEGYRRLLKPTSKFWVTSGIDIDMGVTGVKVNAQSLATIARGGVGMITVDDADDGPETQVDAGSVFKLHDHLDDQWLSSAAAISLMKLAIPSTLNIHSNYQTRFLGITRNASESALGFVIADQSNNALAVFPADVAQPPPGAIDGSFSARYSVGPNKYEFGNPPNLQSSMATAAYPHRLPGGRVIPWERIRNPTIPEDCFVVRGDEDKTSMQMLGRQSLSVADDGWNVLVAGLSRSLWHGAPVISAADERLIGMLNVSNEGAKVVPLQFQ